MAASPVTVALAGNPNCGKTTLFNALTGARQHVGNYPGVTVEKKTGRCRRGGTDLELIDLPGTYSLTAASEDEVVARNFILDEQPAAIVNILDASNLQRNLYLSVQLMELGVPLVLALNMADVAEERGLVIDHARLSELLGVPVVRTVAHKGEGLDELVRQTLTVAGDPAAAVARHRPASYGDEVEHEIAKLTALLATAAAPPPRWWAIKLLEGDEDAALRLRRLLPPQGLAAALSAAEQSRRHLAAVCGQPAELVLTDRRYGFITGACQEAVRTAPHNRYHFSDRIDSVMTNRVLGLPLFLLLMLVVFQATFALGNPLSNLLDGGKEHLAAWVSAHWPAGSAPLLRDLVVDGVIQGVGAVVVFVPLVALLFLMLAALEDSGYMTRAAFVTDRLMHHVGLHGKSFIPMLIGFGCTVPAILAARTLESRRDRLTTMLILPLISCSARLPIYLLILGAFFPQRVAVRLFGFIPVSNQALWLLLIYLIGVLLAVLAAKLLRRTIFRGESSSFVMELPPYRLPTVRGLLIHTWARTWLFLRKAGTVILLVVIVLWALARFPSLPEDAPGLAHADPAVRAERQLEYSVIGRVGRAIEPVMRPCGFDWRISTALVGAMAAKEVFVGQMGVVFAVGQGAADDQSLRQKLQENYTPLQGFCIMLFCLISMPCMATVSVAWRESGAWHWAALQFAGLTALAWILTAIVYQVGRLF